MPQIEQSGSVHPDCAVRTSEEEHLNVVRLRLEHAARVRLGNGQLARARERDRQEPALALDAILNVALQTLEQLLRRRVEQAFKATAKQKTYSRCYTDSSGHVLIYFQHAKAARRSANTESGRKNVAAIESEDSRVCEKNNCPHRYDTFIHRCTALCIPMHPSINKRMYANKYACTRRYAHAHKH
eukprot:6176326-Pleurochrysis_carterae.AAC.3